MKFHRNLSLTGTLLLLAATVGAFAAVAPSTNAPPAAPAPAVVPAPTGFKLDDYIGDLAATLKLTDLEKKDIETYYLADGVLLNKILNDGSLSPLQKARHVSDLRDIRNTRIEALLHDIDRQSAFPAIEAKYRVALTELAAAGGLVPALPPPAPAAAPAAAK